MVFVCFSRVKKLHTAPLMTNLKHSKPELNSLADCFLRLQQILDTHNVTVSEHDQPYQITFIIGLTVIKCVPAFKQKTLEYLYVLNGLYLEFSFFLRCHRGWCHDSKVSFECSKVVTVALGDIATNCHELIETMFVLHISIHNQWIWLNVKL